MSECEYMVKRLDKYLDPPGLLRALTLKRRQLELGLSCCRHGQVRQVIVKGMLARRLVSREGREQMLLGVRACLLTSFDFKLPASVSL
jgi:hypothetical protein